MTLGTLNFGDYGTIVYEGHAGLLVSTVVGVTGVAAAVAWREQRCSCGSGSTCGRDHGGESNGT